MVTTPVSGTPSPVAAWRLRGDGLASVGDLDLEFVGGYSTTPYGTTFDGVTGRALTRGPGPLDTTASFTLSAWVSYQDQLADVPMVVTQVSDEGSVQSVGLGIGGDAWIFGTSYRQTPGSPGAMITGPPAVRSDEWVFLVGVSDREAGVLRFYIDGAPVGEIPAGSSPFLAGGPLVIGLSWGGAIADVAAYQSVLTDGQIADLHATSRPAARPPVWTPDPSTYAGGVLDGTWDYVMGEGVDDDLLGQLRADYGRNFDEVIIRIGFEGQRWWQGFVIDGGLWLEPSGAISGDGGVISVNGDHVVLASHAAITTYRWVIDESQLSLDFVSGCTELDSCSITREDIESFDPFLLLVTEHTYLKSSEDGGL